MQDEQKTNEEEKGFTEELNFDNPDFKFIPSGVHNYRQEGYYLICRSCELHHGIYIGPDKVMVGEKDGQPILKKRKEVGMT
jgi:hypothetical protein